MVIPRVFVVATNAEANDLIVPTVIDRVTLETGVISYMAVRLVLLMWPIFLNRLHLQLRFNLRLYLNEWLLRLVNTRSFFASLMPPNLPPLLLLPRPVMPRPVMPLPILHTLLVRGFSIPVHLIICLVIRISYLPLLSLHPDL